MSDIMAVGTVIKALHDLQGTALGESPKERAQFLSEEVPEVLQWCPGVLSES